jgi:hypothetical protein
MERKLRFTKGQAIYALRKMVVEPAFGQIKGCRGLNRFQLRGLEKVNWEWALMATTHNLLQLFRATLASASGSFRNRRPLVDLFTEPPAAVSRQRLLTMLNTFLDFVWCACDLTHSSSGEIIFRGADFRHG